MARGDEHLWINVVRNENLYSDSQWARIKARYPRRIWGVKVAMVSDGPNPRGGHGFRERLARRWA
jgi:hypothetical protein